MKRGPTATPFSTWRSTQLYATLNRAPFNHLYNGELEAFRSPAAWRAVSGGPSASMTCRDALLVEANASCASSGAAAVCSGAHRVSLVVVESGWRG